MECLAQICSVVTLRTDAMIKASVSRAQFFRDHAISRPRPEMLGIAAVEPGSRVCVKIASSIDQRLCVPDNGTFPVDCLAGFKFLLPASLQIERRIVEEWEITQTVRFGTRLSSGFVSLSLGQRRNDHLRVHVTSTENSPRTESWHQRAF